MTTGTNPISDEARVVVITLGKLADEPVADSTQTADVLPETAHPTSKVLLLLVWVCELWERGEIQVWQAKREVEGRRAPDDCDSFWKSTVARVGSGGALDCIGRRRTALEVRG